MSKWRSVWHRLARGSSAWQLGFLCGVGFCALTLFAQMDLAHNFHPCSSNRCNLTGKTVNLNAIRIRAFPFDSSNRIPASAELTHAFPDDLKLHQVLERVPETDPARAAPRLSASTGLSKIDHILKGNEPRSIIVSY
jgi:hypothetical protein